MKQKLSIQCTTEKEEKEEIVNFYKKRHISLAGKVLDFIRVDMMEIKRLEGER